MSISVLQEVQETSPYLPYEAIHRLAVGESYCMARRFNLSEATSERMAATQEAMHNNARSAMRAAMKGNDKVFTGEAGDFRTARGHNPVICYLITRTK